jgi:hypothetical protein
MFSFATGRQKKIRTVAWNYLTDSYRNNCTGVGKKNYPHKHTFDVELVFRQTYIPVQAFQTDTVKKRLSFINAENFKHVMALRHYFSCSS